MNTYKRYIDRGFPNIITEMIAEACMELPPMTHPDDGNFLKVIAGLCIQTFLENYATTCSVDAQDAFAQVRETQDADAFLSWINTNADFEKDEDTVRRADMVLEDMAIRLPELLKTAYTELRNERS